MNDQADELFSREDAIREAYGDPCPMCGTLRWLGDCPVCCEADDVQDEA